MKKVLITLGVVLLLGGLGTGSFALFADYSNGTRVGEIVKFSKKGVVFKTHEGQLNIGGFTPDNDGDLSNIWEFSVHRGDDAIHAAIEKAMEEGYRVRLHYKEKFYQYDWRGDTKYFIYQVDKVEDN